MTDLLLKAMGMVALIFSLVWMLIIGLTHLKQITHSYSLQKVFLNFGQKMWMTFGLGLFFFGLYFALVFVMAHSFDLDTRLNIFFLAYQSPTLFIYAGLTIFACGSLSIYGVRLIIKHLYNSRYK